MIKIEEIQEQAKRYATMDGMMKTSIAEELAFIAGSLWATQAATQRGVKWLSDYFESLSSDIVPTTGGYTEEQCNRILATRKVISQKLLNSFEDAVGVEKVKQKSDERKDDNR